ncbi:MAG: FAD-binding oxidoreductase [Candidatus Dormibacteraeota bacterium]|nr:FAD-binding oxidoreductase [Candidatus Dormibacteraeota bacterium]
MILERPDFETLARDLAGDVILPADSEYDLARRVWNGIIDKRPGAIVRCANADDVQAALAFAAFNRITVAVRGGGHNIAGNATCDNGIVIDLSQMKRIEVDQLNRTARAEGGVLWGELDAESQRVGLATTGGLVPSTGIAGFTLGGGLGHLMRSYGLACDNLLSAEVITADGRRLKASSDENPDLFWGLRGGGGNFGVVTSFDFRLHEVGPILLGGPLAHPWSGARDALRFYRDFAASAPDNLIVYAGLGTGADGSRRLNMRPVFNGSVSEGLSKVAALRKFGSPIVDGIQPRPYLEIQKLIEPAFPRGRLNYWKANFVNELSDELIDILIDAFRRVPSPYSMVALEPMGGAVTDVSDTATAFQHRTAAYSLLILSGWVNDADSEANVTWARELWHLTQPLSSSGVYVNYLGTEGDQRVRDAYGVNHARLSELKRKYDPGNFFRLNQNIEPAPLEQ